VKFWNWEFTLVSDQLQDKRNEEVGLYGQTLKCNMGMLLTWRTKS
jgi:hypothetical protein